MKISQNPEYLDNYNTTTLANRIASFDNKLAVADWDDIEILEWNGESLTQVGYKNTGNRTMAIETNGTVELKDGVVDWICVSPKDMLYPEFSIKQRKGDELKVVYVGQDMSMYDNLKQGFTNWFLQPCYDESKDAGSNGKTFHETFDVVLDNPGWKLSLQTHKWMGAD